MFCGHCKKLWASAGCKSAARNAAGASVQFTQNTFVNFNKAPSPFVGLRAALCIERRAFLCAQSKAEKRPGDQATRALEDEAASASLRGNTKRKSARRRQHVASLTHGDPHSRGALSRLTDDHLALGATAFNIGEG